MRNYLLLFILLPFTTFSQTFQQQISFNSTGDQIMPLGRYEIGTAIIVQVQIGGNWAQDGGIYHIISDWGNKPKVVYRGESSISNRLNFYGYVDPTSNSHAFLFSTWDNFSANEASENRVKFSISSEGGFDITNTGTFSNATQLNNLLVVQSTSEKVGIGTINTGSHKLAVEGTIGAREIKVESSGWSDFVFEKDYPLKSLYELEDFINKNKHLPDIPNESEVLENGIELGKMDAKLLQKLEELTLYIIQQQKAIDQLKAELNDLKKSSPLN